MPPKGQHTAGTKGPSRNVHHHNKPSDERKIVSATIKYSFEDILKVQVLVEGQPPPSGSRIDLVELTKKIDTASFGPSTAANGSVAPVEEQKARGKTLPPKQPNHPPKGRKQSHANSVQDWRSGMDAGDSKGTHSNRDEADEDSLWDMPDASGGGFEFSLADLSKATLMQDESILRANKGDAFSLEASLPRSAEIDGLSMEKLIAEKFPPGSSSTGAEFFGGKQDDHSINYIPSEKSTFTRDSESRKWPTVYQELAGRQDTQESSWVLNLLRSQGDSHQRELLQSGEGYDAYILGHMMEKEHYGRFNQDNLLSLFGQSGTERPAFDTNQPTFGASASASTFAGVANNTPFLSSNSSALETLSEPPFNTKINEQQASDIFSKLTLGSESGMPPFFGEHSAHHGTQPALWSGAHGNSVPQRSEFAGASQTHGVSHASLNQPFLESPGTNYGAAAARSLKPNQYQGQIPETMFGALDGVVGTSASSSVLGAASSSAGKSVANAPTNHTDGNNVPIPFPMPFTMGAPKAAPVAAQNTVLGTNHTGTLSSDRKAPPQGVGSILTQLMSQAQSSLADGQQSQVADKIGFPFPFPPSSVAQDQQGKGQPSSAATSLPPGHMLQSTSGSVLPPLPFPFNPVHEGHSSQDSFSTQGLAVGFDSRQSHMGIPPFSSPLDLAYGRHPHHPAGLQDSSVGIPLTAAANLPLVPPSYIPPEGISILDIFQTNVHQPNAASMLPAPSATYQVAPQLQLPLQPPALGQDTMPPNHQVASQPQTLPKANTQHPQHVPLTIPPQINPNIRPQGSSQSQYQQPPQLYQLPNHQGQHPTYSNQTQSSSGLPSQSLPQFHQANYYPMMSNPNTHQEPGHGFPENRPFTEFPYPGAIPGVFPIMPFGVTGPQMQAPVGTDLLQQLFDISSQAPAPERKSNSSAALSLEDLEKQLLCKTTPN